MKILLTSSGLRNDTIITELEKLVGKPFNEATVVFIDTAMNVEPGDKRWVIGQLTILDQIDFKEIDIIDLAAVGKDVWLPRIEQSDVIFVNGGNTTYLKQQCDASGFTEALPDLLRTRVYVGASAGSYVATPDLRFNSDGESKEIVDGFGLVDFGLQVHYKSPKFPLAKSFEAVSKRIVDAACPYTVYALDDEMAVRIDGSEMSFVGEGEFKTFQPAMQSD